MQQVDVTVSTITVGSFSENCYIVSDAASEQCLVIDPGAEGERILAQIGERQVAAIVLTHAHPDHIGAVNLVQAATGARVLIHPADAHMLGQVRPDDWLQNGATLPFGQHKVRVVHTPGHTPGQCSFLIGSHALVGDTIFEGGPGRTWCPDDFAVTLATLRNQVLGWPDDAICYPGHGPSFRLGDIRPQVEQFLARQHEPDFWGDAEWQR